MTDAYYCMNHKVQEKYCLSCNPHLTTLAMDGWSLPDEPETIPPRRKTVYRIKINPKLNPTSAWVGIGRGYIDPAQGPPQTTEEGQGSEDVSNSVPSFHCPHCEGIGAIIPDDRWRPEICEKCEGSGRLRQ